MRLPELGVVERFVAADDGWLERARAAAEQGAVERLRLLPSQPGYDAREWHEAVATLASRCDVLPVVSARLEALASFPRAVAELCALLPARRGIVEICAAPPVRSPWSEPVDPARLAAALREGAQVAREAGCSIAWGVMMGDALDDELAALVQHGLFARADAVVLDLGDRAIDSAGPIEHLRAVMPTAKLWLVAGPGPGSSLAELEQHALALALPVERLYWSAESRGALARLWARSGARRAARILATSTTRARTGSKRVLVTGGAGFVGANLCARLLERGRDLVVLDDLSRSGSEQNLAWLDERFGRRLAFNPGDVRCAATVRAALDGVDEVFHLAASVGVGASHDEPLHDFETNAGGTLTLLEEVRRRPTPPAVLLGSTHRVYGDLADVVLEQTDQRWIPTDASLRARGVDESRCLDLRTPHACSKGAADQYLLDYARSFGLRTVVMRMSCVYGPRQLGNEDHGWVAHFMRCALEDRPLTIYGDGKQVRDVLFVDDLVDAMLCAMGRVDRIGGRAYNIGGGVANALSLRELLARVTALRGRPLAVGFREWRDGDQRWYVSDTRRFATVTGWWPRVGVDEGLERLYRWLQETAGVPARSPVTRTTELRQPGAVA